MTASNMSFQQPPKTIHFFFSVLSFVTKAYGTFQLFSAYWLCLWSAQVLTITQLEENLTNKTHIILIVVSLKKK